MERELQYTKLIAFAGEARSNYIEAIKVAKKGDFDKANELMEEGKKLFVEGHKVHFELMSDPSGEYNYNENLLLIHAEDQLASAETFSIVAEELIDLLKNK